MLLALFRPEQHFEELSLAEYQAIFKEFFKPIRNFIYFKCSDMDMAEDLAQDTFLKLWETRSRIDKRTVKAYLYTIAQNNTINQLKRKQLMYKFMKKPASDRDYDTPEKLAEMNQYEEKLAAVIAGLPDGGREVFLMNRLEDLTYNEIAERLGLSVKAIEKRMSKVLKIFREELGTEI
ncbi:MAG: sigma-70 family RNA polymerase sigma factor [Flavobacteriales bacterium]